MVNVHKLVFDEEVSLVGLGFNEDGICPNPKMSRTSKRQNCVPIKMSSGNFLGWQDEKLHSHFVNL